MKRTPGYTIRNKILDSNKYFQLDIFRSHSWSVVFICLSYVGANLTYTIILRSLYR
jgi:hypothetical protein